MCGITGFVNVGGQQADKQILEKMNSVILHRGPDGFGHYIDNGVALAHRRLSIIDLSNAGKQPMCNAKESTWVSFNGEIYNYIELAKDLESKGYRFNSHSDTEVIVHSYDEYGEKCVEQFNGMFGFAIWDKDNETFYAARDRLGIKPFYYYFDGKTFVFGSEIKSLLAHPSVPVQPERSTVMEYLAHSTNWGTRTWFKGIKQLEPGCSLTLKNGCLQITQYWDLKFNPNYNSNFDNCVEELRELLEDSIHIHLRSDVLVGSHLSGGIDSSSIVALASKEVDSLHTFSGAFSEGGTFDEREFIDIVANRFNTNHHVTIPAGEDLPSLLPKLLWHLDEPVAGPGSFPQFHVCQLVQESGIKVVLGGQGGDELFGGYPPYFAQAFRNMTGAIKKQNMPPLSEIARLPEYALRSGVLKRFFSRTTSPKVESLWKYSENDEVEIAHLRKSAFDKCAGMDPFETMSYQHLRYYLPTLLHVEDRTSMACSIESRVPLLDYRIVEFAACLPSWMKVRKGTLKYMLRHAMRGKTPDRVLDRKDKKGFPTPIGPWFRGPLANWVKDILSLQNMHAIDYVNPSVHERMLHEHMIGDCDHSHQVWKLINLELWLRGLSQHG